MKKWKCEICGFISTGEKPKACAVCGVGSEQFKEYVATEGKEKLWLCLYCGFIYEAEEAPKSCPECQAKGEEAFVEFKRGETQFKDAGESWKCKACGHLSFGEKAPEECPKCGASNEVFQKRADWLVQRAKK